MIFEGEVGRDSGVLVGDDVIGVLDPDSENLLLPLVKMSCFFQLKREQNQTSVEITLKHYTLDALSISIGVAFFGRRKTENEKLLIKK